MSDGEQTEKLSHLYGRLRAMSEAPAGVTEQARLVELLQTLDGADVKLWADTSERLRELLNKPKDRWEIILSFTQMEDLRRALRYKVTTPLERHGEEAAYPRHGWFGDWLDFSNTGGTPVPWLFWAGVTIFGAACRRNFYIDWGPGEYFIWPNHYVVIVGPSGAGKSKSINAAEDVLRIANDEILKRGYTKHGDLLIDRSIATLPRVTTPEFLFHTLAPVEKGIQEADGTITKMIRAESSGLLVNDELSTLLSKTQYRADGIVQLLTDLYTCPASRSSGTLTRNVTKLENVAVSCLFGSTVEWLSTYCTPETFEGGFMGRCVFVPRNDISPVYRGKGRDPVVARRLGRFLADLALAPFTEMELCSAADEFLEEWFYDHTYTGPPTTVMAGYHRRKREHVLKLAILLHLSYGGTGIVSLEELQQALNILDIEEPRLPKVFGDLTKQEMLRSMDELYAELQAAKSIVDTKLFRRTLHIVSDWNMFCVFIKNMEKSGWLTRSYQSKSHRWVLTAMDRDDSIQLVD